MLRKDVDTARCHQLCIIALFKSDKNQAKRILIGRKLVHHMEDNKLNNNMQYSSRPAQQCQSVVFQKVLAHNISHVSKHPSGFIENDAIGCYDRIANNLALLLLQCLGFAISVCKCIGNLWDNTIHFIKTGYGTSKITYKSTTSTPLFGPGQGSTTGPPFWLIVFFAITESLDPLLSQSLYRSVCYRITVASNGAAFVDDASLGITSNYKYNSSLSIEENTKAEIHEVMTALHKKAQHWEVCFSAQVGRKTRRKVIGT
jgi:hypothetical protein